MTSDQLFKLQYFSPPINSSLYNIFSEAWFRDGLYVVISGLPTLGPSHEESGPGPDLPAVGPVLSAAPEAGPSRDVPQ